MKTLNKIAATILVAGMMTAGTASAMGLSQGTQPLSSIIGVSSAAISVNVDDGVATLFGTADSGSEAALAAHHVSKLVGVDKVVNLITYN